MRSGPAWPLGGRPPLTGGPAPPLGTALLGIALLGIALPAAASGARGGTPTQETLPLPTPPGASQETQGADGEAFEVADALPSNSESAAVRPVIGVNQKVRMLSEKKDLGVIGYVLGITMTVIIVATGAGIVLGYVYKRGKDLKEHREQKTYEREMQRITLPLSAFTNPACEIVDEKTIVIHTHRTPGEDAKDGNAPLMGQAGTPGA